MAMRSVFLGLLIGMSIASVATAVRAADSNTFDLMGFKLGATPGEIEAAAKSNKLADAHITPGPSFEQAVQKARRQVVESRNYASVQIIRAKGDRAETEVTFAPTPDGPRAVKIVYDVMPGGIGVSDLEAQLVAVYGEPDRMDERGWVWGDTAAFYSRKSAYLELRPHPVSAGARKPDATLILADPSLRKRSQEAITDAAAKGG